MENNVLFPGSTIGIIGDSPSGVMLAQAAQHLGFKVVSYSRHESSPVLAHADVALVGRLNDKEKLADFAQRCDLVTYESDEIDVQVIRYLSHFTRVPQNTELLELTQDRLLERAFFEQMNVNIAPYATIINLDDIYQAMPSIGYPCVLKPIQKDFNPKRIRVIRKQTDIADCAELVEKGTYILESHVDFEREVSLIMTKTQDQKVTSFPLVECRVKEDQTLALASMPAQLDTDTVQEIERLAQEIAQKISYVGCFELSFYLTKNGTLYFNRLTPALSNAGYIFNKTVNVTMFEQHLRALAQIPLVQPEIVHPGVLFFITKEMENALRTQWVLKDNWFYDMYRIPEVMQHKTSNIGHVLVLAESAQVAQQQIETTGILK